MRLPHHKSIIVVCLALALWSLSAIDCGAQEALILPSKPFTVNKASDYVWVRPVERHTKLAIGAVVATIVVDAVATGWLLHRVGQAEDRYSVSLVNRKEVIGTKALGNFLTLAQLMAQARQGPKTTTTVAGITAGLNLWSIQQNVSAGRLVGRVMEREQR